MGGMTLERACEVMNERRYSRRNDWFVTDTALERRGELSVCSRAGTIDAWHAIAVAEKLLRDAAAKAEPQPACGPATRKVMEEIAGADFDFDEPISVTQTFRNGLRFRGSDIAAALRECGLEDGR